jgi:hypothetical protein
VRRIDARPIPDLPGEIRAVMIVRNEIVRLESNLRHHRDLGVDRFIVIDNGSEDGTIEFLEAQPDVHLFSTADKFSSSWGGALWKNALLDGYATGHWVLNLDADELFVFPRYETLGLRNFCAFLDGAGARGVFCSCWTCTPNGRSPRRGTRRARPSSRPAPTSIGGLTGCCPPKRSSLPCRSTAASTSGCSAGTWAIAIARR